MPNLFLNSLNIKNFRCFEDHNLNFSIPDGTLGSGLNLLIGENGCGKTTVLDAISFLTQSGFSTQNKLEINDFRSFQEQVIVTAKSPNFRCAMPYKGNYFMADGIQFTAASRTRKAANRVLSAPITTKSEILSSEQTYRKSNNEFSDKPLISLYKQYSSDKIEGDDLNVFYFDKNRSRQSNSGTFKTTFDRICEDLNWKFLKNLSNEDEERLKEYANNEAGFYKKTVEVAQKGIGKELSKELSNFFDQPKFKDLKIDLMQLLKPFSNAFFSVREDDTLSQISTRNLGSGVEIALTLLLLKSIYSKEGAKGSIVFLIDEPELHLHPKAQEKLAYLLLEESKTKQIIVASHSPYFLKPLVSESELIILKDTQGSVKIEQQSSMPTLFPWSPSWGEITFKAFGMATVEFHNELYGHLQERSAINNIKAFDQHMVTALGLSANKSWIEERTYIRHSIHHPENQSNPPYTPAELKQSIEEMIPLA